MLPDRILSRRFFKFHLFRSLLFDSGRLRVLYLIHPLNFLLITDVDELLNEWKILFYISIGKKTKPDYLGFGLMNCLKNVALFILLLRPPEEVVPDVKLQLSRSHLETFDGEIHLLPAIKTLLNVHLKSLGLLPLIVILRIFLNVDIYLTLSIQILKTAGKGNCFFVQFYLLFNTEVRESLLKMRVNHELATF